MHPIPKNLKQMKSECAEESMYDQEIIYKAQKDFTFAIQVFTHSFYGQVVSASVFVSEAQQ